MRLRIAYATASDVAAALPHMARGAVLVPTTDASSTEAAFDTPVELELTMPDGTVLTSHGKVLQVLAGHGVAVAIDAAIVAEVRLHAEERAEPAKELTHAQKIQLALRGTRDQRNAILRDKNRALHVYVLKNPQMTVDDVIAIAKNPQMGPDIYKHIAERSAWFHHPQVALALARNPKVGAELAVRALAHVTPDALRQMAKGVGAPPHVVQAARKRVIGK